MNIKNKIALLIYFIILGVFIVNLISPYTKFTASNIVFFCIFGLILLFSGIYLAKPQKFKLFIENNELKKIKRSKGITIIAIVILILNGISLLKSIGGLCWSFINPESVLKMLESAYHQGKTPSLYKIEEYRNSLLVSLPFAIPYFISAIAVLKLKEWGRKLLILLTIISCIYIFWIGIIINTIRMFTLIYLAINCLIIFFFTRLKVKDQFK